MGDGYDAGTRDQSDSGRRHDEHGNILPLHDGLIKSQSSLLAFCNTVELLWPADVASHITRYLHKAPSGFGLKTCSLMG